MSVKSHEFTSEELKIVYDFYAKGYSLRFIAEKFNSNHKYIAKLVSNKLRPTVRSVTIRRLIDKVVQVNDCWIWIGTVDTSGYGQIKIDNKTKRAHRVSFEIFIAPIPNSVWHTDVLHLCNNKRCINPQHLYLGSDKDNRYDALLQGAYSDRQTFTADERDLIKHLNKNNISQRKIAELFNRSRDAVRCALKENEYDFRKFE